MVSVKVVYGANTQDTEGLVGQTVADARESLADVLNIPAEAQAMVAGQNVDNGYELRDGDVLEFVMPSGSKG